MASKSFFAKLTDGTFLRSYLGVKKSNRFLVTCRNPLTGQYPVLSEQLSFLFTNLDLQLTNMGRSKEEVTKFDLILSDKGYKHVFQLDGKVALDPNKFKEKWTEYFGTSPYVEDPNRTWYYQVVPEIPGDYVFLTPTSSYETGYPQMVAIVKVEYY